MLDIGTISAEMRDRAGKGTARAARRSGKVPAVIYGEKKDPLTINLEERQLSVELRRAGFFARQYDIDVGGDRHRVLARDVQLHPVTDVPLHVDFLRVGPNTQLRVDIPVHFEGEEESPGLKRGGVLNIVRHEVEVICAVSKIPEAITINLDGLDIGDSVHISEVGLPEGVKPTITDRDFTIATIAAPTVVVEEEAEAAEGEEGEELVEGEEAAEGEEAEATEGGDEESKDES